MYENDYNYGIRDTAASLEAYISKVFGWMFLGLLLTAFAAFTAVAYVPLRNVVLQPVSYIILSLAEIGLVIYLSARVEKMSASKATGTFLLYSALNGITLSAILLYYGLAIVFKAFIVAAVVFGVMAVYGAVTKTDLTHVGGLFIMGVIGIIIASLVNLFFRSKGLDAAISYIGVFLFLGLTAYDTQRIKAYYTYGTEGDAGEMRKKGAIISALALYLDFINILIFLIRLFGRGRD